MKLVQKLSVMLVVMGLSVCMNAQTVSIIAQGECGAQGDNLEWVLYSDSVLVISGTGDMVDYVTSPYSSTYRYNITTVIINDGVTTDFRC